MLSPVWLAYEFLIRQPHRAAILAVENSSAVKKAQDTSSGGPFKELSILPAVELDVGRKPIVGVNASWRYHHNEVALQAGTWGSHYVVARATERYEYTTGQRLSVETTFTRRSDLPFYGVGSHSRSSDRFRYEASQLRVQGGYSDDFWRQSRVRIDGGARGLWFGDSSCCDDPPLRDLPRSSQGSGAAPGYGQSYAAPFQRLSLDLDSARPDPKRGASFVANVFEEATFANPSSLAARSWVRWGGMVGARLDLTGTRPHPHRRGPRVVRGSAARHHPFHRPGEPRRATS